MQWSNDEFAEALHINIYECNEATTKLQTLHDINAMKQDEIAARLYILIRVQWSNNGVAEAFAEALYNISAMKQNQSFWERTRSLGWVSKLSVALIILTDDECLLMVKNGFIWARTDHPPIWQSSVWQISNVGIWHISNGGIQFFQLIGLMISFLQFSENVR